MLEPGPPFTLLRYWGFTRFKGQAKQMLHWNHMFVLSLAVIGAPLHVMGVLSVARIDN